VRKIRGFSVNTLKDIFVLYETWNLIKLPCLLEHATVYSEQKYFITHSYPISLKSTLIFFSLLCLGFQWNFFVFFDQQVFLIFVTLH